MSPMACRRAKTWCKTKFKGESRYSLIVIRETQEVLRNDERLTIHEERGARPKQKSLSGIPDRLLMFVSQGAARYCA
jgi:hypothetical protein